MSESQTHVALWNHIERGTQDTPTMTITTDAGWEVDLPVRPPHPGSIHSARIRFRNALVHGRVCHGVAVLHTYPDFTGMYPNGRLAVLNPQTVTTRYPVHVRSTLTRAPLHAAVQAAYPEYRQRQPTSA